MSEPEQIIRPYPSDYPHSALVEHCYEAQTKVVEQRAELVRVTAERDAAFNHLRRVERQNNNAQSLAGELLYQADRITQNVDGEGNLIGEGQWRLKQIGDAAVMMRKAEKDGAARDNQIDADIPSEYEQRFKERDQFKAERDTAQRHVAENRVEVGKLLAERERLRESLDNIPVSVRMLYRTHDQAPQQPRPVDGAGMEGGNDG